MPLSGVTSAGIAIGTPAYMAPEQLAGDATADHRMDIYAVGLLAYELLTGVSPFTGPSPRETLAAQLTRDPKPLHEVSPEIPRSLSALIMRCLAKDPAARPQTRRGGPARARLDDHAAWRHAAGGGIETPKQRRQLEDDCRRGDPCRRSRRASDIVVARRPSPASRPNAAPVQASAPNPTPAPAAPPVRSRQSSGWRADARVPPRTRRSPSSRTTIPCESPRRCGSDSTRRRLRDSVAKAKLAEETQRKMMDSIIAANSAAAPPAGRSATDRHRRAARSASVARGDARSDAPSPTAFGGCCARASSNSSSSTTTLFAPTIARTRDVGEITKALNSDLVVSIRLTQLPHDSAMLMLQVFDFGAMNAYRARTAGGKPVPKNEVLSNLDQLLLSTVTYLDEMMRAPRRPVSRAFALTQRYRMLSNRQHAPAAAVVRDVDQSDLRAVQLARVVE